MIMFRLLLHTTHYLLRTVFFVSILLSTYYLLPIPQAHAAGLGFSTNKSLFEAEILPGTTYQDRLVIFNNSNELPLPMHLQLSLWNLKENTEEDIEYISAEDDEIDATKWFYLELPDPDNAKRTILEPLTTGYDFILNPADEQELVFRVVPPKDVPAGTYLVTMRLQAILPGHYFEGTGPRFVPEMNLLFFFRVPFFSVDDLKSGYAAEIISLGLTDERTSAQGSIVPVAEAGILEDVAKTLVAKVRNTGMFYFKAMGRLEIRNWQGEVVKHIALPGRYLLPGRIRSLDIPLGTNEKEGGFLRGVVNYFKDNAYLGKYTATLILEYPDINSAAGAGFAGGATISETVGFWVMPWKLMLIVAGIVALITIFIKQFSRRILAAIMVVFSRKTYRKMRSRRRRKK